MDLKAWEIFRSVENTILQDVRMAMVLGKGKAGLLVMTDGDVFSLGSGPLLGLGTISCTNIPKKVAELSGLNLKGIFSGGETGITLTEAGQLYTWGESQDGQLGLGIGCVTVGVPTRINLPEAEVVTEVASSEGHNVALTKCGKVYCWGSNEMLQVCPDQKVKIWTPKLVDLDEDEEDWSKVKAVACNTWSTFALRSNGKVWAWGTNYMLPEHGIMIAPTCIPIEAAITKVVCGALNTVMLDDTGALHFWEYSRQDADLEPIDITGVEGVVTDILATWSSSLNVCETASGIYLWGQWLGKRWSQPTLVNFASGQLVFAVDNNIMCSSILMRSREKNPAQEVLTRMFNSKEVADTKFIMNDKTEIYVHRAILASRSNYFCSMFNGCWKESGPLMVKEIAIRDVVVRSFRWFVKYLYTGSLDHELLVEDEEEGWSKLLELMQTAQSFTHIELSTECRRRLISLIAAENSVPIFQVANRLDFKDLEEKALNAMAPEFSRILESVDIPEKIKALCTRRLSQLGLIPQTSELALLPLPSPTPNDQQN